MSGVGAPSWDDCVLDAASALDAARASGVTLGCAESCTGGLVAGALTAVAGSSDVMRGGVVSYAIPVKHEVLGVSSEVLDAQMAEGARRVLGCDVAVSVTGIAGPGGAEPGKPVGTVWMGLATPLGTRSERFLFPGPRDEVRRSAVAVALALLREGSVEAARAGR